MISGDERLHLSPRVSTAAVMVLQELIDVRLCGVLPSKYAPCVSCCLSGVEIYMGASALRRHHPESWSLWWTHGTRSGSSCLLSAAVPGAATHSTAAEAPPCAENPETEGLIAAPLLRDHHRHLRAKSSPPAGPQLRPAAENLPVMEQLQP